MSETAYNPRVFRRQLLKTIALDGLVAIVLLLGLELFLRAFVPSTRQFIFTDKLTGGHPVKINSLGFRDDEIDKNFPADGIRIMVIGNSVTFGYGVDVNETYARQLKRMLNARGDGVRYDVINGSGQGSSVREKLEFLEKTGLGLGLDAVVLGLSASNLAVEKGGAADAGRIDLTAPPKPAVSWKKKLMGAPLRIHILLSQHSVAYMSFDRYVRWTLFRVGLMKKNKSDDAGPLFAYGFGSGPLTEQELCYRNLDESLGKIKSLLDGRGIPFFIVAIPSRFEISDLPLDNPRGIEKKAIRIVPGRRFREMADRHLIPYGDMTPIFSALREKEEREGLPFLPLYITADYVHLDPGGHKAVAEEIAGDFINHKYFPQLPDKQPTK